MFDIVPIRMNSPYWYFITKFKYSQILTSPDKPNKLYEIICEEHLLIEMK